MKRLTVQLIIAILLTMSGIVLLFSGFWIDPALEEFTYSRIAVENALDNTPPAAAKTALIICWNLYGSFTNPLLRSLADTVAMP